ncbi:MAG: ATP-binding protein [Hyphomicrobium sp.]|nr:ATP-binding protein [Hyphomicrobium sp.]
MDARRPEPTIDRGMELPPLASMLMQSLRSVGYNTAAALADLVDNSIAAEARTVRIALSMVPVPYAALVDDGNGMDEPGLIAAMRYGSRDPRDVRSGSDLGRFGLGLKTASLSQCKRLTVASLRDGRLNIARWDLDECDRRESWWLERPVADELPAEPLYILQQQGKGTAVIWEKLDRTDVAGEQAFLDAADHLALVFHRYLGGEFGNPLSVLLNERSLVLIDPFLEGHSRGQALHAEPIWIDGHAVKVSPFVLPFPSRLKPGDLERAGGRESLKTRHGFYIYRGGRLVVPGGWFRIVPTDDLIRLARIRIDVPVELDRLWKVDIRKTIAEPPPLLRPHLRRIVGGVIDRSRRVYTHKGIPADDTSRIPLWQRVDMRDGGAAWRINKDHPAVRMLLAGAEETQQFSSILKLIEESLPIHDIHIHTSNDQPVAEPPPFDEAELETLARKLKAAFADKPELAARMLENLPITEPFSRDPDAARRILGRL